MIPIETIRKAAALIGNSPGVLVGTAALQLLGYRVDPFDLDFLVEKVPDLPAEVVLADQPAASWGPTAYVDGVKVDYIFADKTRRGFMRNFTTLYDDDGRHPIFVARVDHVLALKAFADRPKDREFFKAWGRGEV